MRSLENKIALITGASRGIGEEIAKRLAKEKVNLALIARDEKRLRELKEKLEKENINVFILSIDLREKNAPKTVIGEVIRHFERLDILINNAGTALSKPIIETSEEEWDEIMTINAKVPYFLCKYAIPYLKNSEIPTIINISSVVGYKGYVNQSAYTASKHALHGFTKVLAQEVHEYGIRVHLISPGGVATDLVNKVRPDLEKALLIQPSEIAEIIVFLLKFRNNAVIDEIQVRRKDNIPWR
ncbi:MULTISPECIES: SDR family oxidoreductase [Dictyoglomus]|jgi:3-oxoacyl-[acyl-carrier protein] reductase|uniref:Short-chain dehydrogenase/reductase SDR n=1 Tax=Dictyoglomus turgidum (strain DSM 6724 / Z-1310) TaxID=515635 RepID=B8E1U5_DICTD|nr:MULTISPECIES: SDR family oxidoreductase [Dictyoglomus]ACK41728.1 short-chain dehydrogenase/reductase SDR [Dictyoglomus turgidum DSM 6724]PNV79601.1 MAG: SDR family NAD(P)-dependent oxidoreductase [Dictyoglomus turgidum]HBU31776.1 SDR family NAD(P)-dependent oxidoreductase [Dictyoglomus sp.]